MANHAQVELVYSGNVPGGDRMAGVIKRYGPYRQLPGGRRFIRDRSPR